MLICSVQKTAVDLSSPARTSAWTVFWGWNKSQSRIVARHLEEWPDGPHPLAEIYGRATK